MSDHRKNDPFKKCRPIYITHVLIGAGVFTIKKKSYYFPLLPCYCRAHTLWTNKESSSSGGQEQIDESQSFSAVCSIYCSFYHLSCFLLLLLLSSCLYRPGDHRDLVASKVKERIKEEEKKGNPDNQSCIRERSDNIRARKVKDSTIKIVSSEMMEEAK